MWLLPVFSPVARLALRAFYRLHVAGEAVPRTGPVLLVANHPNSLLDPAMVVAFAGRPVRFLAKAPLFSDPLVGWLIRGSGSIPVHRRTEGEALMALNDQTFHAAQEALRAGAAVGIFPEGLSHNDPAIHPLKTGAARIALGAAAPTGRAFPIVPMGLSLRDKRTFRSEALVRIGAPVAWDDLAPGGEAGPERVRELTARIESALRSVTVNLESWHDAPLVEAALEVWAAEHGVRIEPAERVEALREVSEGLARLRHGARQDWAPLAREVARHGRILSALGLRPDTLGQPSPGEAARWTLGQLAFFAVVGPSALLGALALYLPYRATGWVVRRAAPAPDVEATYKVLAGAGLMLVAWALWVAAAVAWGGAWAGAATLAGLPLLGLAAVAAGDRWRHAEGAVRRYLLRTRRAPLLAEMRARQRALAERLTLLRESVADAPAPR